MVRGREQRMKDRLPQRGLAQFVRAVDHHPRLRQILRLLCKAAERIKLDRLQLHARFVRKGTRRILREQLSPARDRL